MKLIRDAIYDFRQNVVSATGDTSDETDYSDKQIYMRLIMSRSAIVKSMLDRGMKLSEEFYQVIPCIQLKEVDIVECPTAPASGCMWLKSDCPIPDYLTIQSVSSHLGKAYSYSRWDKLKIKMRGRLPSAPTESYYTLRTIDDKTWLYIYNNEFLESATITIIPEDPIKATEYCNKSICNPMDLDIHTSAPILDMIIKNTWDTITKGKQLAQFKILNNDSPTDGVSKQK